MRNVALSLPLICLLAGCASLSIEYCYSPNVEGGELEKRPHFDHPVQHFGSGAATHARFSNLDNPFVSANSVEATVSEEHFGETVVLMGPALLAMPGMVIPPPIFPAYPLSWFSPAIESQGVTFQISFAANAQNVQVDCSNIKLFLSSGQSLSPVEMIGPAWKRKGDWRLNIPMRGKAGVTLYYDAECAILDQAVLRLDGITVDGRKAQFPDVRFAKSKGWVIYVSP